MTWYSPMFEPQHCGLYFSADQKRRARELLHSDSLRGAWEALLRRRPTNAPEQMQQDSLLYRLNDDLEAGERALELLQSGEIAAPRGVGKLAQIVNLLLQTQCHELLHDHPSFSARGAWLQDFTQRVDACLKQDEGLMHVEATWLNLLRLTSAIALEDEDRFSRACELFRESVGSDLHFDGYIRPAAEGRKGESLGRMLLTAQALCLCAEAASLAGEPLWEYDVRGVSALTPTPYLLYYYWYPERWRWDGDIEGDEVPQEGDGAPRVDEARALYRRHAGLWELAQARSPSPDRQQLLDELRPVFDVQGGGPLTLTHSTASDRPARRRGILGRLRL